MERVSNGSVRYKEIRDRLLEQRAQLDDALHHLEQIKHLL
jgi:hypothetical protein